MTTSSVLHSARRLCASAASAIVLASCLSTSPTGVTNFPDGFKRVLFVGNSHTYVHNVPGMLDAIARQNGDSSFRVTAVAYPNVSLEDHWYDGTAARHLERGRWEYVVMQQGPSSQEGHHQHLAHWTQQFTPLIRAAGASPVLYQVWPHISRPQDFPAVQQAYGFAAASVNGILAPAGAAWVNNFSANPDLALYDPDGTHANVMGAYVAALTIYASISGVDARMLPPVIPGNAAVEEATVRKLQQAVFMTVAPLSSSQARTTPGTRTTASVPPESRARSSSVAALP